MSSKSLDKLKTAKGKELYEVILEVELESEKEYLKLAEKVSNKKVSSLFKKIAKEERKHHDKIAKQFLDALYQMEEWMMPEKLDLPQFKEAPDSSSVSGDIEYKKALEIALEGEKTAYAIYTSASEKTEHKATKKMLISIAKEEKKHYEFILSEFQSR